MADEKPVASEGGSKKKLFIIIGGAVVLVIIIAVAALMLLRGGGDEEGGEDTVTEGKPRQAHKAKDAAPPVMFKLDQFTVKLTPDPGRPEQYMQTTVELEVLDNATMERTKLYTARIKARLLLLMMNKTPTDLATGVGVEQLANEIRSELNQILDGTPNEGATAKARPDDSVQAVYLTQFLIQ